MYADYLEKSGRWITLKFEYSPFKMELVKKYFNPHIYLKKSNLWKFPFNLDNVDKLQNNLPNSVFSNELKSAIANEKAKLELITQEQSHIHIGVPGFKLYPYQHTALEFIQRNKGRAILALEVGMGKSIVSLAYKKLTNPNVCVIVCPNSLKFNWRQEIKRYFKDVPVIINAQSKKSITEATIALRDGGTIIINYESVNKIIDRSLAIDLLILDEFTQIKSFKSARSKAVKELSKKAIGILGLSGTPILNKPIEIFGMMNMLDKSNFYNVIDFAERYCNGHYEWFGPKKVFRCDGSSNLEELSEKLKPYMIRMRKADVLQDLPPMRQDTLEVELENYNIYKEAETVFIADIKKEATELDRLIDNIKEDDKMTLLVKVNALQQCLSEQKTPAIANWLKEHLSISNEKILVFCQHLNAIHKLASFFDKKQIEVITGETPMEDREAIVNKFNNPKSSTRILVLSQVGIMGLNLTAASIGVFMEHNWVPELETQACGRLMRIGQKNPVTVYYTFTPDTIDVAFQQILQRKIETVDKIINKTQFYGLVAKTIIDNQ